MMAQKNKTILITGGCGFVGQNLLEYLLKKKLYDRILVCCHKDKSFSGDDRVTIVNADLLKPNDYLGIFEKYHPDEVIHLAAMARYRQGEDNPETAVKVNIFGTINLLELAQQFGVKRFLNVSSNLARNPQGVTGVTKYLLEAFIKMLNEPPVVSSIRLPNVIDSPGAVTLIFKRQIESGETITITDKRMTRKFITSHQAAEDLVFALNHGKHGEIFINNKPSTPIVELAQKMIVVSGKAVPIKFVGMRPGEKLQEEDYPAATVLPTIRQHIFLLAENQHDAKSISKAINLLKGKVTNQTQNKIKALFKSVKQ